MGQTVPAASWVASRRRLAGSAGPGTVKVMGAFRGVLTTSQLFEDIERVDRFDAAWVARSWVAWTPTAFLTVNPNVMLMEAGNRGKAVRLRMAAAFNAHHARIGHRHLADGLTDEDSNEHFWHAARALGLAMTVDLDDEMDSALRTPYLAGRWIGTWLREQDPLLREVAQAMLAGWDGDAGTPAQFIGALGPLAVDLAGR